jgi:DNA-binding CsgD family transcriptional regulator
VIQPEAKRHGDYTKVSVQLKLLSKFGYPGEVTVATQLDTAGHGAGNPFLAAANPEATIRDALETLIRSVGCRVSLGLEGGLHFHRERYAALSRRERQVLALVVQGLLNKLIAAELGISEFTVKAHRGRMMRKMGANSVPELVIIAASLSLASRAVRR